jgi:hypothetical protein
VHIGTFYHAVFLIGCALTQSGMSTDVASMYLQQAATTSGIVALPRSARHASVLRGCSWLSETADCFWAKQALGSFKAAVQPGAPVRRRHAVMRADMLACPSARLISELNSLLF